MPSSLKYLHSYHLRLQLAATLGERVFPPDLDRATDVKLLNVGKLLSLYPQRFPNCCCCSKSQRLQEVPTRGTGRA